MKAYCCVCCWILRPHSSDLLAVTEYINHALYCKAAAIIIIWADKSTTCLTAIDGNRQRAPTSVCMQNSIHCYLPLAFSSLFIQATRILDASRFLLCHFSFLRPYFAGKASYYVADNSKQRWHPFQNRAAIRDELSSYHGATLLQCFSTVGLCRALYVFYVYSWGEQHSVYPSFFFKSQPHLNLIGILQCECASLSI